MDHKKQTLNRSWTKYATGVHVSPLSALLLAALAWSTALTQSAAAQQMCVGTQQGVDAAIFSWSATDTMASVKPAAGATITTTDPSPNNNLAVEALTYNTATNTLLGVNKQPDIDVFGTFTVTDAATATPTFSFSACKVAGTITNLQNAGLAPRGHFKKRTDATSRNKISATEDIAYDVKNNKIYGLQRAGTPFIYEINPATCTFKADAFGTGVDVLVLRANATSDVSTAAGKFPKAHVESLAVHPVTGDIYVAGQDANNASANGNAYVKPIIYKIDRTTGAPIASTSIPLTDAGHPNDGYNNLEMEIESMSFDEQNRLWVNGGSSGINRVNLTSGAIEEHVDVQDGGFGSNLEGVECNAPGLGPNAAPVVENDQATTGINTAVVIDVLDNDFDPEGMLVRSSLSVTAQGASGMAVVDAGTMNIVYTPTTGIVNLTDTFKYEVCDSMSQCTEGSVMVSIFGSPDKDGDGINDVDEGPLQLDDTDPDTDGDGLCDGTVSIPLVCVGGEDAAGTPRSDALDADTDDDGLKDGAEDKNGNGVVDAGETDPDNSDTDADGLPDGLELGIASPVMSGMSSSGVMFPGTDTTAGTPYKADGDAGLTKTSPVDDDSDDDGIKDGNEDANKNGVVNNTIGGSTSTGSGETDPNKIDTDGDLIRDGVEIGLTAPQGVNTTGFLADSDPAAGKQTNPVDTDTDNGTVSDGLEDVSRNGSVDGTERDPNVASDDLTDVNDVDGDGVTNGPTTGTDLDEDEDNDGIPDVQECKAGMGCAGNEDDDGDGVVNKRDLDSDNDGIPDLVEAGFGLLEGDIKNGRIDNVQDDPTLNNGWADAVEDMAVAGLITLINSDADARPDFLDRDADGDGISDLVEGGGSDAGAGGGTAGDGEVDGFTDANDDGWSDPIAATPLPLPNSDNDGPVDYIDTDSDNDKVPDAVEGTDANGDGKADVMPSGGDADDDGLDETFDGDAGGTAAKAPNHDSDALPDYRDADDDGDGVLTIDEDTNNDGDPTNDFMTGSTVPNYLSAQSTPADNDDDGVPDATECPPDPMTASSCTDTDGDGTPDWQDNDDDGDGLPTRDERPSGDRDTDSDGRPDHMDNDDDNDGLPTQDERPNGQNQDADNDGTPNHMDADDDNDGIPTQREVQESESSGLGNDMDGDGLPNWLDTDSDGDGIPDGEEALDADGNGIPDYLEANGDGFAGGALGCGVDPRSASGQGAAWLLAMGAALLWLRRRALRGSA